MSRQGGWWAFRVGIGMLILMAAVACRGASRPATPDAVLAPRLQELQQQGRLTVGTALTAPFEFHDPETGALVGFDVEIARAIAARLGVPVEWKEMAFADLLPTLEKGEVDLVIAAMYITPERQQRVAMSDPYLGTGLIMVVRATETDINTVDDLAGRVVGVKEGATGARFARHLQDQGMAFTIQEYADTRDSLEDLSRGFADVVLNDKINSMEYIRTHRDLKIVGDILEPADLGIAVRQGDTELLALVNEVLQSLRDAGTLEKLYAQWIAGPR